MERFVVWETAAWLSIGPKIEIFCFRELGSFSRIQASQRDSKTAVPAEAAPNAPLISGFINVKNAESRRLSFSLKLYGGFYLRGRYPPAEEYLNHALETNINLVEAFKNTQVDEEGLLVENADSGYVAREENGEHVEQEQEVEADDSTNGAVLVNGNDEDEDWGTNNKGTSSE